jgi:hypothetical protein
MAAVSDVGSNSVSRFQFAALNMMSRYAVLYRPMLQLMSPECAAYNNAAGSNGDNLGENR